MKRYYLNVLFGFSRHIFNTVPNITKRADTYAWTHDVRMTKPIGAFRDYVNPPKNVCSQTQYFYALLQNCEEQPLASTCLSVRPFVRLSTCNNSAPTGRIFTKFDICVFFENLSRKFKYH
jgi:hypothetical protein